MALEQTLVILNLAFGIVGVGGIGGIGVALWKGGASSATRKKEIEEINNRITVAVTGINEKLDGVKTDVADLKHDIRNGGLKEAVSSMQSVCSTRMAIVETRLKEHTKLGGHPGVTERIAAAEARIENLGG